MPPLTTKNPDSADRFRLYALYSLSAVFIAFSIIGVLANALLPSLEGLCNSPVNDDVLSYTFSGIATLLSDSFLASVSTLGLLAAFMLCAFSLFAEGIISAVTALCGFSCGCVLYYTVTYKAPTYSIVIYVLFYVVGCVLSLVFAALCVDAGKRLSLRSSTAKTIIKLFIIFLSFCGAICLLKTMELLLL